MGDIYRVTVTRETENENGDGIEETLFELAGSAAIVAKVAPGAVAESLGAVGSVAVTVEPSVSYFADAAGNGPSGLPVTERAKVRRPRRSAAQKAADEAQAQRDSDAESVIVKTVHPEPAPLVLPDETPQVVTGADAGEAPWNPFVPQ